MFDLAKIEKAVKMILEAIGEDPNREGLVETPARVAKMYREIFSGLAENPQEHLDKTFSEQHEEMVLVKDIQLFSMCEHHLIPFIGKAHVCYIPRNGNVTGLSKLVRLVNGYAHRPQLQERLTTQIADAIMSRLNPYGVLVVVEAEHLCMSMRGVRSPGALTVTSAVRGIFKRNEASRSEALSLILKR